MINKIQYCNPHLSFKANNRLYERQIVRDYIEDSHAGIKDGAYASQTTKPGIVAQTGDLFKRTHDAERSNSYDKKYLAVKPAEHMVREYRAVNEHMFNLADDIVTDFRTEKEYYISIKDMAYASINGRFFERIPTPSVIENNTYPPSYDIVKYGKRVVSNELSEFKRSKTIPLYRMTGADSSIPEYARKCEQKFDFSCDLQFENLKMDGRNCRFEKLYIYDPKKINTRDYPYLRFAKDIGKPMAIIGGKYDATTGAISADQIVVMDTNRQCAIEKCKMFTKDPTLPDWKAEPVVVQYKRRNNDLPEGSHFAIYSDYTFETRMIPRLLSDTASLHANSSEMHLAHNRTVVDSQTAMTVRGDNDTAVCMAGYRRDTQAFPPTSKEYKQTVRMSNVEE